MTNSFLININVLRALHAAKERVGKVFFSSSACVYPREPCGPINVQFGPGYDVIWDLSYAYREKNAYPAHPDSEYGWEKLYAERLYQAYARNYGLDVRIARFHNVFGPEGTWQGGREKFPAAICRKVAEVEDGGGIEVWGDGTQQRSFLYVSEAVEGIRRLMDSSFSGPVNIGSDEMVSVNDAVDLLSSISGKSFTVKHVSGPVGVAARNSDNTLIREMLGWAPSQPLRVGLEKTYAWISEQVDKARRQDVVLDAT
jgi:nucleoside-diphosphate-sugar epimerase